MALRVALRGSGVPGNDRRHCSRMRAAMPVTVGAAMEVPHLVVYEPEELSEVTPKSPPAWQPGAETSGLMRPSSTGPHDENELVRSVSESTEPTAMWFL